MLGTFLNRKCPILQVPIIELHSRQVEIEKGVLSNSTGSTAMIVNGHVTVGSPHQSPSCVLHRQ